MRTCTSPGCSAKHWAKGYCSKHYQAQPKARATKREWERRNDSQRRDTTGWTTWPCLQCAEPIGYAPRGGNRTRVCGECAPDGRFRALVRRYGLDKQMFEAMYFEQDGKCSIPSCTREARAVDHCHYTGEVRGLLCKGCNVAVGFIENGEWLIGANAYIKKELQ